jgi:putative endonuclease
LYIGQTNDVNRRIKDHNKGRVESTKSYIPYKLIYVEEHSTREDAVRREKELKTTEGRRFLKKLI